MIIIGIDPGSAATGYGLLQIKSAGKIVHIANGTITTSSKESFSKRLLTIHQKLREQLEIYQPAELAVEDIFYAKNVKSALKLGHVRGVVMLTAMQQQIPVFEYTPTQIKQAVTGYGRAEKIQVQRMLKTLLKIEKISSADASDALAVAICHSFSRKDIGK